jgi:hypothetical protein
MLTACITIIFVAAVIVCYNHNKNNNNHHQPLFEQWRVVPCADNLMEEKFCVFNVYGTPTDH